MPSSRAARSTGRPVLRRSRLPSWDHRRGFDFEARLGLHQAAHLHHGHGGKVLAHELAVRLADRFQCAQVFLPVEHVPGETHDVLGFSLRFLQHRDDVLQGLPKLPRKVARFPLALAGPADLPGDEDERALGGDAVREALGAGPPRRLQDRHSGALSLKRCSLPVSVRGSVSTNSIARGYLYGAITFFTCSCNAFAVSGSFGKSFFSTTYALTMVPRSESGAPTTPHSATAGCFKSAPSTSGPAML